MPILEWSEIQPRLEVTTAAEFDHAIDRLASRASANRPSIVALYAHGHQVILGLGLAESFVQIQQWGDSDRGAALVTVGDQSARGEIAFYRLGAHRTEIPRRNLIPTAVARKLVKGFLESGKVSQDMTWEPA